jgi:hypothetical protein
MVHPTTGLILTVLPAMILEPSVGLLKPMPFQATTILLCMVSGFFLGKAYSKIYGPTTAPCYREVHADRNQERKLENFSKYLINGNYAKHFKEIEVISTEFSRVLHVLEKKCYSVRKRYLADVSLQ